MSASEPTSVQLRIDSGAIKGVESADGKVRVFKGIPYAAAPVGPLRWKPPQPVLPWEGVRPAVEFGARAMQDHIWDDMFFFDPGPSEDCLYLNVWTPALGGSRPVMVWFHGGGYTIGSGSWPLYDGTNLARRGDVVVVTVNHRLGSLGYLHLGEICGEAFASSGNVGMLDCVAVLEWVRDNAQAFGGDPGNVTIFGESGGGAKVSTLLAMPAARGLFHRAAIQSGPGLQARTVEQATRHACKLLEILGIDEQRATALWDVPPDKLVEAQTELGMRGFGPVVDDAVLPDHPGRALRNGTAADVPILVGCNKDEASMGLQPFLEDPSKLDDAAFRERLEVYGEHADELVRTYEELFPDASRADLLCAIQTDGGMRMGSIRLAEARLSGGTAPVFMYFFRWEAGALRSAHGFEIMFVFDNVGRTTRREVSSSRAELSSRMSEAWLAFARSGDPNHPGLPRWPAYTTPDRATMVFDRGVCWIDDDPSGPAREVWEKIGPVARASVLGG